MRQIPNSFTEVEFTEEEENTARTASPYLLAYIQNKIAAYANQVIKMDLPYDPDPTKQMLAFIELERMKARVNVLEELFAELQDSGEQVPSSNA